MCVCDVNEDRVAWGRSALCGGWLGARVPCAQMPWSTVLCSALRRPCHLSLSRSLPLLFAVLTPTPMGLPAPAGAWTGISAHARWRCDSRRGYVRLDRCGTVRSGRTVRETFVRAKR